MAKVKETYNNLIDLCILLEEKPEFTGNAEEMFRYLLTDYFFKTEISQSKGLEMLLNDLKPPEPLKGKKSLFEVQLDDLEPEITGTTVNDSLAGRIMLAPQFLKAFYPHHAPSFGKLPEDVKFELMDRIKEKNLCIIEAFKKMARDRESDKNRKIITLIALILKNISQKTGRPLAKLERPADSIIRASFAKSDEIFNGSQRQISDLSDDVKIKDLLKTFFVIRQFSEIAELAQLYRIELSRYRKRGIKTGTS
ncbi:MAG: hypothetical protein JXA20_10455 [Spirochaetes bacterium]|nr:hypothetical protein [Spirochaetota bacterium]